ncbi:MAG: lipoprotein-releasing ABC transporter permease subunit [Rickettsiales bacterium]|jgi:lipoprotein-releasing system permease protein|nr:lipoprotein-releasing ABC transporter permease subunit [Rickettsiales bacterium]
MFNRTEIFIAFRYLKSKRKEGFISINGFFSLLGIAIGVATLIVVMSIMNGFRIELMDRILGINSHINIISRDGKIKDYYKIIPALEDITEMKSANLLINTHAMILHNQDASAANVRGIKSEDLFQKPLIANNIKFGDKESFLEGKIMIGSRLADKLGLSIGSVIRLVAPQTNSTFIGLIPRIKDYEVGAIFEIGMYEYDSSTIFIPLEMVAIQFNYYDAVSQIEVMAGDITQTDLLSQKIQQVVNEHGFNVFIHDWQAVNSSYINALKVERNVMFLILTLIIIVASFNIISSLVMLVQDKMKNIALMRTIGLTRANIIKIFFICGATIGFIGTSLGVIFGSLFVYNINNIKAGLEKLTGVTLFDPIIYFLSDLPSHTEPKTIIGVGILALVISFLAAIYPAWKASKCHPAEILRYE